LLSFAKRDIRNTIRIWRRNPGSTIAIFAAFTLGIGAATSVFCIANSVLIAPLPVPDANRVVRVTALDRNSIPSRLSLPDVLDLKQRIRSAEAFGFYRDLNGNLGSSSRPMLVHVLEVDASVFSVLGVKMAQGRAFTAAANQPGQACAAVISWALWQSRFHGEPIADRMIRLNEKPCQIAGVLPPQLDIPVDADIWTPKTFDFSVQANGRAFRSYYGIARLRHDVTAAAFHAELNRLAGELARENPATDLGLRLQAVPLREVIDGDVKPSILILFVAVMGVLLMACASVANLLLARASARLREISVRIAIGASRASLLQQMLTESLLLTLLSSLTGIALSALFVRWIRSLPSTTIPRPESVSVDWRVMLFALAIGGVTGVFFGVLPALRVSFSSVMGILSQAGGRISESRKQQAARKLLIAGETALATLLLISSLLLLRSFREVSKISPGFQTDHLLTAYVSMNLARYPYAENSARFARKVIETLKTKPGIIAAAFTTSIPFQGGTSGSGPVQIEGRPAKSEVNSPAVMNTGVSPDFRATLGIPLKAGVDLREQDDREEATAVLVNSTFAKTFFPNENAVGRRIRYAPGVNSNAPWQQIAGIIGDTRQLGPEAAVRPEIYRPLSRASNNFLGVVIRTADDPAAHLRDLEAAVHQADAELPVFYPRTMDQVEGRRLATRTFVTTLIGGLAWVAWLLASGGIFAVISYSVSLRTTEMGVRMAVGATQSDLLRMVLAQGLTPAFSGIAAGMLAALLLTRYLAALLYGVQADDFVSYAATAVLLGASAALAAWLPARRAAAIEPWQALRQE